MGRILHGDHKAALFHLVTWGWTHDMRIPRLKG